MNPSTLLTSTATVDLVEPTGPVDGFGDPTEVITSKSFKCWLSQTSRSEDTANANSQQELWDLFLEPAAVAVDGWDRVTVDGKAFELDGPPWPALNPRTQTVTHLECKVRRSR